MFGVRINITFSYYGGAFFKKSYHYIVRIVTLQVEDTQSSHQSGYYYMRMLGKIQTRT